MEQKTKTEQRSIRMDQQAIHAMAELRGHLKKRSNGYVISELVKHAWAYVEARPPEARQDALEQLGLR